MNAKQIVSLVMIILGVVTASTAQMTDLFGPTLAKSIISIAGMLNSILAGVVATISTQSALVKDVQAMPGVEKIQVNDKANQALATLAIDPQQDKIETKPGAEQQVRQKATFG